MYCSVTSLKVHACARRFKRPMFKLPEFGVRKGSLMEKVTAGEDGGGGPQSCLNGILREPRSQVLSVKGGRVDGARSDWPPQTSGASRDPGKSQESLNLFVPCPLLLRLLKIFDKQ